MTNHKFIASLGFYFLALHCLPSPVFPLLFPGVIILYDLCFSKSTFLVTIRNKIKYWGWFILIALTKAVMLLPLASDRIGKLKHLLPSNSLTNPFFNMVYSYWRHWWLLVWPVNLSFYHEPHVVEPQALLAMGGYFVITILLSILLFKKHKPLVFSLAIVWVMLFPVYSPWLIAWLVAERYLYFPSIALSVMIVYLLVKLRRHDWLLCPIIVIVCGVFCFQTAIRNQDWKDEETLWRATIKTNPQSPKANMNMGGVYQREGNLDKALKSFVKVIQIKPRYAEAWHNLGNVMVQLNKPKEAVKFYAQAVKLKPDLIYSWTSLGNLYTQLGDEEKAKICFQNALTLRKMIK